MPSRKKRQGRARKATREPRPQPNGCRHGCTLPPGHVCDEFVKACYDEWDKVADDDAGTSAGKTIAHGMNLALKKCPLNESDLEKARPRFVEDGVNLILRESFNAFPIAAAILELEFKRGKFKCGSVVAPNAGMKAIDILHGCKRTSIGFFRKRIPCSCLDGLYAEAKETLTKMGRCYNCGEKKEHSALMDCSRCEGVQYCSKECQVAHWPLHKECCDMLRKKYRKEGNENG